MRPRNRSPSRKNCAGRERSALNVSRIDDRWPIRTKCAQHHGHLSVTQFSAPTHRTKELLLHHRDVVREVRPAEGRARRLLKPEEGQGKRGEDPEQSAISGHVTLSGWEALSWHTYREDSWLDEGHRAGVGRIVLRCALLCSVGLFGGIR